MSCFAGRNLKWRGTPPKHILIPASVSTTAEEGGWQKGREGDREGRGREGGKEGLEPSFKNSFRGITQDSKSSIVRNSFNCTVLSDNATHRHYINVYILYIYINIYICCFTDPLSF